MKTKNILISGAGIAGLTLAYWLKLFGFHPTLVEKHACLRTGGYKIDLRGAGLEVIKRMGLYPAVSAFRTAILQSVSVNEKGEEVLEMTADLCGTRLSGHDLEIMRGTLCHLLRDCAGDVECLFDDSVVAISQQAHGVQVEFEKHPARHFDLVIGADGLHSNIRKLAFGKESTFSREFGIYVAVFSFPNYLNLNDCEIEHHALQKFVNLYKDRSSEHATAALAFSLPQPFSSRDPKEQMEVISKTFAESKWEMEKILQAMKDSPNFYFDSMAQIHLPRWSKGRVGLIGDAAYCATPLAGQGTSIAIVGAYVLAGELLEANGDYEKAFERAETLLRPFIKENQNLANMSAKIMSGSPYSVWLHRIMAYMPGTLIHYFKHRALKDTTKAANGIVLKDYHVLRSWKNK